MNKQWKWHMKIFLESIIVKNITLAICVIKFSLFSLFLKTIASCKFWMTWKLFSWVASLKTNCIISLNPQFFPSPAQQVIIFWINFLNWDGNHIGDVMALLIEMPPNWMIKDLPIDITSMVSESVTKPSLSLTNINKMLALFATNFVNDISWLAIQGWCNLPGSSSSLAWIWDFSQNVQFVSLE